MTDPDLRALLQQAYEGFTFYALPEDHPAAKRSSNPYTANEMKSRIEEALARVPADRRELMQAEIEKTLVEYTDVLVSISLGDAEWRGKLSNAILDAINEWL